MPTTEFEGLYHMIQSPLTIDMLCTVHVWNVANQRLILGFNFWYMLFFFPTKRDIWPSGILSFILYAVFTAHCLFWGCFSPFTDIQEFYEVTLLNTQKSCEEKLDEVNTMADKWERAGSPTVILQHPCPGEEVS